MTSNIGNQNFNIILAQIHQGHIGLNKNKNSLCTKVFIQNVEHNILGPEAPTTTLRPLYFNNLRAE